MKKDTAPSPQGFIYLITAIDIFLGSLKT